MHYTVQYRVQCRGTGCDAGHIKHYEVQLIAHVQVAVQGAVLGVKTTEHGTYSTGYSTRGTNMCLATEQATYSKQYRLQKNRMRCRMYLMLYQVQCASSVQGAVLDTV